MYANYPYGAYRHNAEGYDYWGVNGTVNFFRFLVPNDKVAVEPFPEEDKNARRIVNGVLAPIQRGSSTGLQIVFFSGDCFFEGARCHVPSKLATTTSYAKEIYEVEGRKFILIPKSEVLLVDHFPDSVKSKEP